jgi:prolyl-tRNA editing enzyme YbaK/EbsC (Cys-tRNA(Pro) deacylase)
MGYDEIGISSGVRGIEVIMDPKDLKEVSGAEVLELT